MSRAVERIVRYDALSDALRAVDRVLSDQQPDRQAFDIIDAIQRLRDERPARVVSTNPVDYLNRVQSLAQAAWLEKYEAGQIGPEFSTGALVETPIGILSVSTWRRRWSSGRIAWASEYSLDGDPISVAEIKDAGLARRPTSRCR